MTLTRAEVERVNQQRYTDEMWLLWQRNHNALSCKAIEHMLEDIAAHGFHGVPDQTLVMMLNFIEHFAQEE